MKLNLKKKLVAKSGKVKSVDFHPTFNWVLLGLYDGSISIYDYNSQTSIQFIEVTPSPIRCAKFMAEKHYIICGADDKKVRVYNYNTMEKVKEFEAHGDFIRYIAFHSKDPLFLTCSDDTTIKLYNADKDFQLVRTYEEHKEYVMKIAVNPRDYSMFASAGMDSKIKIWSFNAPNSQMTLEGHSKGCTSVSFCHLNDKPYLASGSDDYTVRVWDCSNKHCVFTFKGHERSITSLCFHPEFPILITGSEDQVCKLWNINTGKLEDSKIFGYDVIWDISSQPEYNMIGFACEEATLVFQMGSNQPLVTFSSSQSKIVYAQQNMIFSINLKQTNEEPKDGEIILISPKQIGTSDLYPSSLSYSPNGKYFSILSNKEFIISTSGAYRSSFMGNCIDFAWNENDSFVTKEGSSAKIYKELKEYQSFKPGFAFDSLFGGPLFALKTEDAVYFYDCDTTTFIRKIDVSPTQIIWNTNKKSVALICDDITYILLVKFNAIEAYIEEITEGSKAKEDGCDESFEPLFEISDKVLTGFFLEELFIYQNTKNKISYALHDKAFSITTLNSKYYLMGYIQSTNRLYFINKQFQIISYIFPMSFVNYQLAILNKDNDRAKKMISSVPIEFNDRLTTFLDKFGFYEISYSINKNSNQKFSLALKLKKLNDAWSMAQTEKNNDKMKMVADLAFELGEFSFAEMAMKEGKDYNGLLLYYSSIQDKTKLEHLAHEAEVNGVFNVAFSSYFQLNNISQCLKLLIEAKRYPEASIFCRAYCPSQIGPILEQWNQQIEMDSTSRMMIKIVTPINEENEETILKSEKIMEEYYSDIKESDISNQALLKKYQDVDVYGELKEGNVLNISAFKSIQEEAEKKAGEGQDEGEERNEREEEGGDDEEEDNN